MEDNQQAQGHAATIFEQPWWWDAVAPDGWDEARVEEKGRIVARLPYVTKRRAGLKVVTLPPLTPHQGPWIELTAEHPVKRHDQMVQRMEALVAALPSAHVTRLQLAPRHTDWLPFRWAGFEQTTRYTNRLSHANEATLWENLHKRIRTEVRKGERETEIRRTDDLDGFLRLVDKTFQRQDADFPYDRSIVRRLDEAVRARDAGECIVAVGREGAFHAGAYFVRDETAVYYLLSGSDPELRSSGAMSAVLWAGIRSSVGRGRSFDFEGSMMRNVARHFRAFGGDQVPYHRVQKTRKWLRPILALTDE